MDDPAIPDGDLIVFDGLCVFCSAFARLMVRATAACGAAPEGMPSAANWARAAPTDGIWPGRQTRTGIWAARSTFSMRA